MCEWLYHCSCVVYPHCLPCRDVLLYSSVILKKSELVFTCVLEECCQISSFSQETTTPNHSALPTNVSTWSHSAEMYFAKISMFRGFSDNCSLSPCRPLIPVSKLTVSESYENYMSRSYQVTKDILSDCRNSGKSDAAELLLSCVGELLLLHFVLHSHVTVLCWCCNLPGFPLYVGNNVLIVAHASSLEACTRQLQGRSPQSAKDFIQVVRKVCSYRIFVFL